MTEAVRCRLAPLAWGCSTARAGYSPKHIFVFHVTIAGCLQVEVDFWIGVFVPSYTILHNSCEGFWAKGGGMRRVYSIDSRDV